MATLRQDLGPVTAYAYAVSEGYTGTEEEFAEVLANFADSAEQVAADAAQVALDKGAVHDDKEAVDSAEGRVTNAVNTFTTTTAPNAVTAVENAGAAQIGLVEAEGTRQIGLVADKGTEQVGTVSSEGTTQIGLVEAKGAEVIASIPGDYSTLQGDIASTYSSSSTYAVGDYVLYSGQLYRCTTAISTAEAWTSAKWTAVALGDDVSTLKSALTDLETGVSYDTETSTLEITSSNQSIKTDGTFANAGGYSLRVDVTDITKVRFIIGNPMTNPNNPYPITAFVAANGHILKQTAAGTYGQAIWYEEDVPYSAKYFYINTWTTNATINGVTIVYSIVDTIMDKAGYDVDAIKKAVYVAPTQKIMQGSVNASGIATETLRLVLDDAIPVKIGDIVRFKSDNLYSEIGVRTAPPNTSGTILEYKSWKKDNTFVAAHDGYLYAIFANASTYGTSTEIVPQDYIDDGAILFKIGADLAEELVTQPDVKKNTFISDYNEIDYKSYVTEYIEKLLTTSQNTEQFIFYTDPHIAVQYGNTNDYQDRVYDDINFIEAIYNASPISYFLSGGDWLGHGDTPATAISKLSFADGFMRKKIHHYYPMLGNHDVNEQGVANVGDEQRTGKLDNATLTNVWQIFRENQQMYYTVSAPNSKVYVFNSGSQGEALASYQIGQLKWFANALESDNSPHIILTMHILYVSIPNETIQPISKEIMKIAQAYNNRTTIYVDDEEFDFTTSTGKISFCIAGHYHEDINGALYDIPYVLTKDGTAMSTSEKLCTFDMCIADWENKKLHMIRVGDGSDRTINIL